MKRILFIGLLFLGFVINSVSQEDYEYLENLIRTNPDLGTGLINGLKKNLLNADSSIRYELIKAKALLYSN